MSERQHFEDDDDLPLVPIATVYVRQDENGVLVYSAASHDWLSIHHADAIARALHDGADALHLLADTFGPAIEDDDGKGAELFTIVTGDDEGKADD